MIMSEEQKHRFAPPKEEAQTQPAGEEDYVFRFPLEPEKLETFYDDPLLELVRGLLADLLDCVILTYHGERVKVDGFRLLQDLDTQYEVFPKKEAEQTEE
jgi:hypothetical protein